MNAHKWQEVTNTNVTRVINYNAYAPKALTGYGGMVTGHWDLDHRRFHLGVKQKIGTPRNKGGGGNVGSVWGRPANLPLQKKWYTLERAAQIVEEGIINSNCPCFEKWINKW